MNADAIGWVIRVGSPNRYANTGRLTSRQAASFIAHRASDQTIAKHPVQPLPGDEAIGS